ncbi:hypothetical protein IW262DRAFT_1528249, partial [Armillaria fumosa]
HGFKPIVIPGVSSTLAGPTFAGILVIQCGAAELFITCTGVGRKGKHKVNRYGCLGTSEVIMLMGVGHVAHLPEVINTLIDARCACRDTPIALIGWALMPDQQVIDSTLKDIVRALDSVGEQ